VNPTDQERLGAWLQAARAGADSAEREAAAPDDGVTDLGERQRRVSHLRRLSALVRNIPVLRAKQARDRRFVWAGASVLAAAAVMVLSVGAFGLLPQSDTPAVAQRAPSASLRQVVGKVVATRPDGQNHVVSAEAQVLVGDEVSTTADAFASLEAGRARVDLSAATTLQLAELESDSQVFRLQAGRVDVSVPKLPGNEAQRIQVTTADATVTVHGTVFSVEVLRSDNGSITNVAVTRGLVAVERKGARVLLQPGDSWSSRSEPEPKAQKPSAPSQKPSAQPGESTAEAAAVPIKPARAAKAAQLAQRPKADSTFEEGAEAQQRGALKSAAETERSRLAEQNRLFEHAMRARDRGEDQRVVGQLRQLLSSHPDSPLQSTALSELAAARRRLQAQNPE
jgi:hypothetical protein